MTCLATSRVVARGDTEPRSDGRADNMFRSGEEICVPTDRPIESGTLQLPSKTRRFFRELSRVRSTESSGFMERAMGIELHPTILSLIERRRYRRSMSQLVLYGAVIAHYA